MHAPWMLDELAHAGAEHVDPAFVSGYDRKAGYERAGRGGSDGLDPAPDIAVLRDHGLDASSTVIDMGAGTGRFALAVAPHVRRVIAVDVSEPMLAALRDRAAAAGIDNVECAHAGFLSYTHRGDRAHAIHTRNALHQLPDFWKAMALDRMAGMLRPHGVLRVRDLIYDFRPSQAAQVFARWLDGAADDPTEGYTAADLAEHIRSEHSTFRWLFEPMLAAAGFEVATAEYRGGVYGAYTCIHR